MRRFHRLSLALTLAIAGMGNARWVAAGVIRDITQYGAVPNDSTDDLPAITAAINASSPGDTVLLPAGTFLISGAIVPRSGLTVVGAGRDSTTVKFMGSGAGTSMINLENLSSVEVGGLTLDGNDNPNAWQGIAAASGAGLYIHDSRVRNLVNSDFGPHGVYFESAVTDSRIVNNEFSNIGTSSEWGSGIRMDWGSSRNQVLGNSISNTGRGGIFGANGSTDLVIRGNTITGSGLAPNGLGLGIEVWNGCDRALVENNTLDHWLSVDSSSLVAVRHNTISDTTSVKYAGIEFATSGSDNVFANNVVNGGAQIGVSVSNDGAKQRVYWAHNSIQGAHTWAAQIQGDTGGAQQMYFFANGFQGTTAAPPVLYSGQGNGFRFNGNSQLIDLDSNTISGNVGIGIQSGDGSTLDKLRVVNNTISNNGGAAFTYDYGTVGPFQGSNLLWQNNTVSGNGNNYQPASKGSFFNSPPAVSIVGPMVAVQGIPVNFSFNYSGTQSVSNVLWDLGDGLPVTTSNLTHTYSDALTYQVGLVIWDALGRAAHDERLLTVNPLSEWQDISGNWSVAANWSDGAVPNLASDIVGFLGKATQDRTVAVNAPVTVGTIFFDNATHPYTLSGSSPNKLTLSASSGNAAINDDNGRHMISAPIVLANNTTLTVVNAADTLTLSGSIAGTGTGLTKEGSGTLILSGQNSYGGPTIVDAGGLDISADSNLGAAPLTSVADQLKLNGGTLLATENLSLAPTRGLTAAASSAIAVADGKTLIVAGNLTVAPATTLLKTGNGALILSGPQNWGAGSVLQIGGSGSVAPQIASGNAPTAAPEPTALAVLTVGALCLLANAFRRRRYR